MSTTLAERHPVGAAKAEPVKGDRLRRSYWPFVVPALVVVGSVIVFPWVFTIWMSLHEWTVGGAARAFGLVQLRPSRQRRTRSSSRSGTRSSTRSWR